MPWSFKSQICGNSESVLMKFVLFPGEERLSGEIECCEPAGRRVPAPRPRSNCYLLSGRRTPRALSRRDTQCAYFYCHHVSQTLIPLYLLRRTEQIHHSVTKYLSPVPLPVSAQLGARGRNVHIVV